MILRHQVYIKETITHVSSRIAIKNNLFKINYGELFQDDILDVSGKLMISTTL